MFSTENTGLWATDMSLNQALVLCCMITYCIADYKFTLWFVSLVSAKTL